MPRRPAPLRQQGFRIALIAIGPLAGVTGVLIGFGLLSREGIEAPPGIVIGVVAVLLVVIAAAVAVGLLIGRRLVGERIELGLKGPGGKWRHARIDVDPGVLHVQPYRWQLRIPAAERFSLRVDELGPDTGRRPQWRQWWSLNPQLSIVALRTDRGDYEIAGVPAHLEELRERLITG